MKDNAFSSPLAFLAELKARIAQHILNVTPETLRSVLEHTVSKFQLLAENSGQHTERDFCTSLLKFKKQFDECFLCCFWPQDNQKPI